MFTDEEYQIAVDLINDLRVSHAEFDYSKFEARIRDIVVPILRHEGFQHIITPSRREVGIDLLAEKSIDNETKPYRLGMEFKFSKNPINIRLTTVQQLSNRFNKSPLDQHILITNAKFTDKARDESRHKIPFVELMDLTGLEAWLTRLKNKETVSINEIQLIIEKTNDEILKYIEKDEKNLDKIEWFDLERILSRVFSVLGFEVTLTRPSKDGGKDLILKCLIKGENKSYIVEIKHWKSGVRVGNPVVKKFINVIVREDHSAGLILSSSDFTSNIGESISEISKEKVYIGGKSKIVSLIKRYHKIKNSIWSPPEILSQVIFDNTSKI
jgi:restriction system protein